MRDRYLLNALLTLPLLLWPQSSTGSGGGTLSPRTQYVAFYQGHGPDASIRLLLVLRGQPGWESASSSSSGVASASASTGPGVVRYSLSIGAVQFDCTYDPAGHALTYRGRTYQLADTNVMVIDRIDGVGGLPEIIRRLKVKLPGYDRGRNMAALIREIPELQELLH
jgi:hypothetical protein